MPALYQLVGQLRELEQLADSDEFPVDALRDTLEGLEGEIEIKAENVAAFVLSLESTAEAIDQAAAAMLRRRSLLLGRAQSVREYLFTNMKAAGITEISCPYFKIKIKKNPPKIVIDDEGKIPAELFVYPVAPAPFPDKATIKEKIRAGETVDGCHVEQGDRLDIRV